MGTGDGLFIYNSARTDLSTFFIGIDANVRPLQKISEKIYRKPARGGLANVLFVQSAVETLPSELDGIADQIYVNFPWGSLLHGVVTGDEIVLRNLRRLCAPGASLRVVIGLDVERDRSEIERLRLPPFNVDYFKSVLPARYARIGLEIIKTEKVAAASLSEPKTSWARRLKAGHNRSFIRIQARALKRFAGTAGVSPAMSAEREQT